MATQFVHRLIVIIPVARVAVVGAWFQANIDPADDCTTWPALNASGLVTDPITHRWCSTALTDAQAKALLAKLCQLASVAPPTNPQWTGWTGAEKRTWLASVRAAIRTGFGIYLALDDNVGVWSAPSAALAAMGLKAIQGAVS